MHLFVSVLAFGRRAQRPNDSFNYAKCLLWLSKIWSQFVTSRSSAYLPIYVRTSLALCVARNMKWIFCCTQLTYKTIHQQVVSSWGLPSQFSIFESGYPLTITKRKGEGFLSDLREWKMALGLWLHVGIAVMDFHFDHFEKCAHMKCILRFARECRSLRKFSSFSNFIQKYIELSEITQSRRSGSGLIKFSLDIFQIYSDALSFARPHSGESRCRRLDSHSRKLIENERGLPIFL